MSAYSFLNHRMFVAALGHDETVEPRPAARSSVRPARADARLDAEVMLTARGARTSLPGVLLANALGAGFPAATS